MDKKDKFVWLKEMVKLGKITEKEAKNFIVYVNFLKNKKRVTHRISTY